MSMMAANLGFITGTPLDRIACTTRRRRRLRHPLAGPTRILRADARRARSLGKPVKWVGTRFETLVAIITAAAYS